MALDFEDASRRLTMSGVCRWQMSMAATTGH